MVAFSGCSASSRCICSSLGLCLRSWAVPDLGLPPPAVASARVLLPLECERRLALDCALAADGLRWILVAGFLPNLDMSRRSIMSSEVIASVADDRKASVERKHIVRVAVRSAER